jgi:outer membrane receptor protein involved in Fe transport
MVRRKQSNIVVLTAALMAGSAMIPASALAQSVASETVGAADDSAGDIIVTAQKRSQSINDVGLPITALGSDTLAKQGVRSLDDLARSVPGLTYAGTNYGTPVFTLRGVGFYDYSLGGYPTTSVYVDEVPLPFPVMATHANLDLERVEVLKGPQGTLFGQNSTGGAINYIAAKPTRDLAAGLDVTIGRFGAGEANGFVSGPVTDTLGVRVAGQYGYGNDWQRSYTRDDTLGKKNYLNGRLLADWKPTPGLKFELNLNAWRDTSDPQAGQFIATFPQVTNADGSSAVTPAFRTYPFSPNDPRAADWSPDHRPSAHKRQYQASLRGDLNLTDNIVLTSISSYVDYRQRQLLDLDATTFDIYQFVDSGSAKTFTQELRVAGGEGTPFHWVVGGNYEKSHTFERTVQTYSQSTVANALGNRSGGNYTDQKYRNYAVFANGEYEVIPKVTLKAGGRYTNSRVRAAACSYDAGDGTANAITQAFQPFLFPGAAPLNLAIGDCTTFLPGSAGVTGVFRDTLQEDSFSWRVGVDYKPSRNLLVYANIAKGYKGGSYPVTGAVIYTTYLPVQQESLLDYEAGFKAKLFDRKVGLNGAAFYYDYRNKQLLTKRVDLIAGLVPALANVPKSRVKGLELELTAAPVDGLHLSGGVTYLDAKITNYTGVNAGGIAADFSGTAIPFTPKWQLIGSADYNFPVSGSIRPFIGATVTKRTSTEAIVGNSVLAVLPLDFRSAVPIADIDHLPGYALLDLRAGIEAEDGSWRLMVFGKNVTNKYYVQNAVTAFEVVTRFTGQPATYGITFGYKFGK